MSADLFAAFSSGSFEAPSQQPSPSGQPTPPPWQQGQGRPQQQQQVLDPRQHGNPNPPNGGSSVPTAGADPFAFFTPATQPPAAATSSTQPWPSLPSQGPILPQDPTTGKADGDDGDDGDDGWGDFEVASPDNEPLEAFPSVGIPSAGPSLSPAAVAPPPNQANQAPSRARPVRAQTLELITNSLVDVGGPAAGQPQVPPQQPPRPARPPDPNVLFDADDFAGQPPADDDDDDFGDFEAVAPPPPPPAAAASAAAAAVPAVSPAPAAAVVPPQPPPVADLLTPGFSTTKSSDTRAPPPSQLLSTLTLDVRPSQYPTAPKSPSFRERNPFPGLGVTTPQTGDFPRGDKSQWESSSSSASSAASSSSPVTAWPTGEGKGEEPERRSSFDDSWGPFEDLAPAPARGDARTSARDGPSRTSSQGPRPAAAQKPSDWVWDAWNDDGGAVATATPTPTSSSTPTARSATASSASAAAAEETTTAAAAAMTEAAGKPPSEPPAGPPPTNVPPPAILLSLFPRLLATVRTHLFEPAAVRDRVLRDPAAAAFLRGYLALAAVAGRIVAGRRLRWQRDRFLAQATSISAATPGGRKAGLKLAAVDRSRAARDDQAAAEVVQAWTEVVGRLRSAVAAVHSSSSRGATDETRPRVPELAGGLAVRAARGVPTAARPCVVCGLRRDERVEGVDGAVEDSFGEWWVEFWGHRTCRNFWREHEAELRQR